MFSRLRPQPRRDEQGAMLVLASAGLVLAMIMSGLAIDIGSLAQDARQDQKVADLAALDAIRGVPANYQALAVASAARNGFPTTTGYSVTAIEGGKVSGTCQSVPGSGTACVTVTSPYKNKFPFLGGRTSVTRAGVASNTAFGGFFIGSSLVTIDAARSTLLNKFIGGILKGSDLSLSAVSWQGLAAGDVTLEAFRTSLAGMGFSVGTVSDLLSTNLTMSQILQATATALNNEGGAANLALATQLLAIKALVTNTTQITLGQFMHVSSGADNSALASQLNVFQLITAAAEVSNGSNFISVPDVGISVGSVVSTKVALQVIQPPQYYFGPVGGSVSTAQIDVTVTPKLDLPISVVGLVGAHVKNDLPVHITGAGALGTLTAAGCGASPGITVTVDPTAFSGSATASLDVYASVILLGDIPILRIPTTNVVPATNGGPTDLTFSYPTQFPPPLGTTTSKHAGSSPIGLSGLTTITPGTPVVLNAVAAPLVASIVSTVLSAITPVLTNVDNSVMTPLLQALGLDIGSADVTAESLQCNTPTLSG